MISAWLFSVAALIWAMAMVGAATRLTESGLSITEWAPITGALPPLSEAAWAAEFEKYKRIPEYAAEHSWMSLADFKTIYWWEWGHRQFGRFIGLAYALPFFVFWATGRIPKGWLAPLGGLLALGGLQGAAGWFMVASGLSERTDVSQYRLVLHLGLAAALFAGVLWSALSLRRLRGGAIEATAGPSWLMWITGGLAALIYLQVLSGGFVAGLNAGLVHNSWPMMGDGFAPGDYWALRPAITNLFENTGAVQFNHRMIAYAIVAGAVGYAIVVWLRAERGRRRAAAVIAALALGQTVLGVLTLLNYVPTALGVAHQGAAFLLFAAALFAFHDRLAARRTFSIRQRET